MFYQPVDSSKWCILRTSGGRTIPLARSLAGAGFDVWSPIEVRRCRRGGGKRSYVDREIAIAPTFVFARAAHLGALIAESRAPGSDHPPFSVFRHAGRIPLVADVEIAGMRKAEERAALAAKKKERRSFPKGARVSVPQGAFAGLEGIVEDADGKSALVTFNGSFRVKIATWLLESNPLQDLRPNSVTAALAA